MTTLIPPALDADTLSLIRLAVHEDLGGGDRTVALAIPENLTATANIVARKPGILAGAYLLGQIFCEYQPGHSIIRRTPDGAQVVPNQSIATFTGSARAILSAERVLLNFLSHLSGIATLTGQYVAAVAAAVPDPAQRPAICDTRKTTPGFRMLDKYAVRCGGGVNHRMGLYDGVMLKDSHLAALREQLGHHLALAQLTAKIRAQLDPSIPLWLEVDTLEQLAEALSTPAEPGADIILLDNFTPEQMRQGVQLRNQALSKIQNPKSKVLLESSGGITLENIAAIAQTGVDRISIGALTHSAPTLDLSMEFQ